MRQETFEPRFVEFVPAELDPGVIYVSMDYATASHLCPCGCQSRVVTPLGPVDWQLLFDGTVSLRPSIGNGQIPCRSHYFIRSNAVLWALPMTEAQTRRAQRRDRAALAAHATGGRPAQEAGDPWLGEVVESDAETDAPRSIRQRAGLFLCALFRSKSRTNRDRP